MIIYSNQPSYQHLYAEWCRHKSKCENFLSSLKIHKNKFLKTVEGQKEIEEATMK